MTFKDLQDDLITEIESLLSEIKTTSTDGETVTGVKGYAHNVPVIKSGEGDVSEYFPYFIVRFEGGETKEDNDYWHVNTDIIFGAHDDTGQNGHEHVMIMCQRVVDRFASEPMLNKTYRAEQDMQWAVGEDDTFPFYFAAVNIKFAVPKIGRKEPSYV